MIIIGVSLPKICHGTAHIIGFVAVQILIAMLVLDN